METSMIKIIKERQNKGDNWAEKKVNQKNLLQAPGPPSGRGLGSTFSEGSL
jgi:hypothetical protein